MNAKKVASVGLFVLAVGLVFPKGRHAYYEVIDKLSDEGLFGIYAKAFSPNQ